MPSITARKRLRLAAFALPPQRDSKEPERAITGFDAWALADSGRELRSIVVAIRSESATGYGETSIDADGSSASLQRMLHFRQALLGRDALATEPLLRDLGDAPAKVRAAIDIALLDLRGKIIGAPIYEILAGRTRDKVRALAQLKSAEQVAAARAAGFRAFSVPLEMPGGPTRGRSFFVDTFDRLHRLRQDGEDLVLNCNAQTTAAEAAALARRFEAFHLLWMDEPTGAINNEALTKISAETVTPLGWGRRFEDNAQFQDLLRLQAVDALRPDIARLGISRTRKAAALAEAYYTAVAPYNAGGPIATAAAIQIAASIPNAFSVDVPFPASDEARAARAAIGGDSLESPTDGFLELPTGPGLGLDIDEAALEEHSA